MPLPKSKRFATPDEALDSTKETPRLRVGFVLTPRFTLTAFAGFVDALRLAADEGDRSRPIDCAWAILGDPAQPIVSSCGASMVPTHSMKSPERYDYIVVVGGLLHGGQKLLAGTAGFLREAARSKINLVGVCTGSFVLARLGLLQGYVTCVSWFHRQDFEREFPVQRVVSNRMYVVDRDRLTCAGGTSVVHLAAQLIERHCGRALANKSLRILIEDQPLPANTLQPESVVTRSAGDSVVRRAMLLIEERLAQSEALSDVADHLGISMRQLERRFEADVGMTPRAYRQQLRLDRARWMIEHTDLSVTAVGLECGFGDCSHFSRAFMAHFAQPPSTMRRHSRANRRAKT